MKNFKLRAALAAFACLGFVGILFAEDAVPGKSVGILDVTTCEGVVADGQTDVADALQKVIDANPHRTLWFPDGTYLLSKPIATPADPNKAVSLDMADFAIIKPTKDWSSDEALIRLGGKDPFNSITIDGSNYGLDGGIVDGEGRANGVSIDSGRETYIRNTSIKHTKIGILIKKGANSGSSDSDIENVNIVGNGAKDSIGVQVIGYDNSFSYMRIANVFIGFDVQSGGNMLRNIHPLFTAWNAGFDGSIGFWDRGNNNFYQNCYNDQFSVGFRNGENTRSIYEGCFCMWYTDKSASKLVAIQADGAFRSIFSNFDVALRNREGLQSAILEEGQEGGNGRFTNLMIWGKDSSEKKAYLKHVSPDSILE